MRKYSRRHVIQLVAGLAWIAGPQELPGAVPVIPSSVKTSIRQRVDYGYNVGIVVGMVNQDGRAFFRYGQTSYGSGTTPDEDTLFEIGSVTKVFTSALLAEMTTQGEVTPGDGLETLLPAGFKVPAWRGETINLLHLATHTSGLPANPPFDESDPVNPFAGITFRDLQDFLGTLELPRRPGIEWEYSNLGVGLLGHALANHLGLDYEAALQLRILEPLGLTDTAVSLSVDQMLRRATGHSGILTRPPFEMGPLAGAGALRSSASDLLTFLEYQLRIRPTDLSAALLETQKTWFTAPGLRMGLGWLIISAGSASIFMHNGATMGQTTFAGFDPASGTGVVVLTNTRVNRYSAVADIGLKLLVPTASLTPIVRPAEVPLETLRSYYGRFVADDGTWFDVGLQREHMTIAHSDERSAAYTMYPQRASRFLLMDATTEASATFQSDENDRPAFLIWSQSGITSTYRKQSVPSRVNLQADAGRMLLTVTGDTGIDYVVEGSEDLEQWVPITTTTIWDDPVAVVPESGTAHRFYRVWKPE